LQITTSKENSILFMSTLRTLSSYEQELMAECLQSCLCVDIKHCTGSDGRHMFYTPAEYYNLAIGGDNLREERKCIEEALEPIDIFDVSWKLHT